MFLTTSTAQSKTAPLFKRFARSFFLALCLLQSASYVCASPDMIKMRQLAEKGDAEAQAKLGSAYYLGDGVPQNYSQALNWSLKAAEKGQPEAENILGVLYREGNGVVKDEQKANEWNFKAAEHGFAPAQTNAGAAYALGQGVAQDYNKALVWFRKAAEQGDARACLYLGASYARGEGVGVDYKQAAFWFHRSVDLAKASSQPEIAKQAAEAALVVDRELRKLDAIGAPKQEQDLYSSPGAKGPDLMKVMLIADLKRSPMTEDQFDRYSSQANYRLADKYSDIMVQYLIGNATLEQTEKNQKTLILEAKLAGESPESLDDDIVTGFVKNKLIKMGVSFDSAAAGQKPGMPKQSVAAAQYPQKAVDGSVSPMQQSADASRFDDLIRVRVAEGWARPPSARQGMIVVLQISMLPDGTVASVSVAKSSGDGPFDASAVAALKNIGRLAEMQSLKPSEIAAYRSFKMTFTPENLDL
ncbi:TonB family protein [Pseudomonas sp. SIMBA_041]